MTTIDDTEISRIRRALQRLAGERGWVNGSRLVQRLADGLSLPHLEIRHGLLALAKAGIVDNIGPTGDGLGRVTVLQRVPELATPMASHERVWRELLVSRNLDPVVAAALGDGGAAFVGLSRSDMEHLLDGILRLIAERDLLAGRDPYEISAKYLLGSSKILGKLGKALVAAGLPESLLGIRPRYVLGAGPAHSKFTLLVENPECFERLIGLGVAERLTVIATYGYGISWSGIGVEGRLDRIKIARVSGMPPHTLNEAVSVETCCFWGDLDLAGLDIFIRLQSLIPRLALSGLYGPMLAAVRRMATSHPYCAVVDKLGQIEMLTRDDAIATLAADCRERAVDQEYVSDEDILLLADRVFQQPGVNFLREAK